MEQKRPDELPQLLFDTLRLVKCELSKEELEIASWLHLETLRFIAQAKEPAMHEVAGYLHVKAPTATALVHALVKGGFIERKADAGDRRRVTLRITPKGKSCVADAAKKRTRAFARVVAKLSLRDRAEFSRILSIITRVS